MGLVNHIKNVFDDNKHLEDYGIYKLIILFPASIISSIISIPLTIIGLILIPIGNTFQKNFTKLSLYIQHSVSMGYLYYFQEIFFDTFEYYDIIIGGILGLVSFYKTINRLVNETINNIFG